MEWAQNIDLIGLLVEVSLSQMTHVTWILCVMDDSNLCILSLGTMNSRYGSGIFIYFLFNLNSSTSLVSDVTRYPILPPTSPSVTLNLFQSQESLMVYVLL